MKMKKILSMALATAMMLASVATAEVTFDSNNKIAGVATAEEIAARNPVVSFEVVKEYTTAGDIEAMWNEVSESFFAEEYNWEVSKVLETYDIVKVKMTISNLGTLATTKSGRNPARYSSLYDIAMYFKTDAIAEADTKNKLGTKAFKLVGNTSAYPGYAAISWSAGGNDAIYPVYNPDDAKDLVYQNASVSADFVVALYKGKRITTSPDDTKITIAYMQDDSLVAVPCTNVTWPENLSIGPKVEEPDPEPAADVEIGLVEGYDSYKVANGYIWNVTVNKDMETFALKFYSGDDSIEKSVKNVDKLPKLDGGLGYNFNVGLKLTAVEDIDKADFTADDYTATWPEVE